MYSRPREYLSIYESKHKFKYFIEKIIVSSKKPCYNFFVTASKSGNREEVNRMEFIISLIIAVMGGVICHYIIKWLDGDK